jgi:hypothetical protein
LKTLLSSVAMKTTIIISIAMGCCRRSNIDHRGCGQ